MRHLLVAVLLVGLAVASGVHYDATRDRHWPYPTDEQLHADYDRYVGERVLLFGTVESVDAESATAVVRVDADGGSFALEVRGVSAEVAPGGVVQVYGTLRPARTVEASNVVVVEASPTDRLYKYAVSVVGALLALGAFARRWRVDTASLTVEPRGDADG